MDRPIDILITEVLKLRRGCDCEYGMRCRRCQQLIDVKELAEKLAEGDKR